METTSKDANTAQADIRYASHKMLAKPLDFSFLKINDIRILKKEACRGGKRKPIPESDEEEDAKKDTNTPIIEENKQDETKEKEKERVIKAPQTNAISSLLQTNNVSLMANKGNFASRKSEDTKVEAKKKIVVLEETRTLFL